MRIGGAVGLGCIAALLACGGDTTGRSTAGSGSGINSGGGLNDGGGTDGQDSGDDDDDDDNAGDDDDDDNGDDGPKFDLGTTPDGGTNEGCGDGGGGGPGGQVELSYIWIANSQQGTISKIDTQTLVEEGRYAAKPSGGDPSRTSVNLDGNVAVANRNGGVAMFYANADDCSDTNGVAGIQTSGGANDILAWGEDECLGWYTAMNCGSNRPVAWTRGTWNDATCSYEGAKVWTVCDNATHLLNGETGAIEQTIMVPGSPFVYGGAADGDGNFWGLDSQQQQLYRVDFVTYNLQTWPLPPSGGYGITVDPEGRPWVCGGGGVSRFNLDSQDWSSTGSGGIGGCMTDGADLIWHSNNAGTLLGFNTETLNIDNQVQLPEYVHGVSVDFYGYVWGVGFANNNAYRADPDTGDVQSYNGLTGAYTYSDMTGFALSSAGGQPPPG